MKQLKSNSQDLKDIFEQAITAKHIAESFRSFDADADDSKVRTFMEEHGYDVIGVRISGQIEGYSAKETLSDGKIGANICRFDPTELVSDTTTLVEVFRILRDKPRVYVTYSNAVVGIVTRGDLQKAPVRMWMFGLLTLLEMQLLRLIRGCHSNEELWKKLLSQSRLDKVSGEFSRRREKDIEIDWADCLQFCDKREILLKSDEIKQLLDIKSKRGIESLLKKAEELRNNLAHAQDIITGSWLEMADLVQEIESLLENMEQVEFPKAGAV